MRSNTQHLTLKAALPLILEKQPLNRPGTELSNRPNLPRHKLSLILRTAETVKKGAKFCLKRFESHQEALWWETKDKSGQPVKRTAGNLRVVIRLRKLYPFTNFQLPAVIKDGLHHKVADMLLSYASRRLDPRFTEKTSYPSIEDTFPIVWQAGFSFYEHSQTGKLYLYLPFFPRGGHEEDLTSNNPSLRKFGNDEDEVSRLEKAKGGLLLPLKFDKWGEAVFMRDRSRPPVWKAKHRRYDKRWLRELENPKSFRPKRVELLVQEDQRVSINIACEVDCKPKVEVQNFMGVALGLHDLITVVVIDNDGKIIHQRNVSARIYDQTVFRQLEKLRKEKGGQFRQLLETFHYQQVAEVIKEALEWRAAVAVETIGDVPKGKYAPRMNFRLSYWPFGKLANFISYKVEHEGLPKPFGVYSATVRYLCSSCGAKRESKENNPISLEGPSVFCGKCDKHQNSGFNAGLNLARRSMQLYLKGVKAA